MHRLQLRPLEYGLLDAMIGPRGLIVIDILQLLVNLSLGFSAFAAVSVAFYLLYYTGTTEIDVELPPSRIRILFISGLDYSLLRQFVCPTP